MSSFSPCGRRCPQGGRGELLILLSDSSRLDQKPNPLPAFGHPLPQGGEGKTSHTSTWIPHSRFNPKKRVSSSLMPGSQRDVVWKSPMET